MFVSAVVATDVTRIAVAANVVVVAAARMAAEDNRDRIDMGISILRLGETGMARSPDWTEPDGIAFDVTAAIWRRAHDNVMRGGPPAGPRGKPLLVSIQVRRFSAIPMVIQLTPAQIRSTLRKMPST